MWLEGAGCLPLLLVMSVYLRGLMIVGCSAGDPAQQSIVGSATDATESKERSDFLAKLLKLKALSQQAVKRLANLNDYERFYETYLKNLLRVRVPGTFGHHEVKKFLISSLQESGWKVELDEFVAPTPIGNKKFTNIVGTLQEAADKSLALAAHYDSKLIPPENGKYFLGATDSAVSCAMLLDMAKVLSDRYQKRKQLVASDQASGLDVSPMILFLDGEEAFLSWTRNDSIYGARHLAEEFKQTLVGSPNPVSVMNALDAFVLLDLIGSRNPQFFNLYDSTTDLYEHLQDIERRLSDSGELSKHVRYFPGRSPNTVEDDHLPFVENGVPVLHLIALPFPKVWHTLADDEEALDRTSIVDLIKILRLFVIEYFHLE